MRGRGTIQNREKGQSIRNSVHKYLVFRKPQVVSDAWSQGPDSRACVSTLVDFGSTLFVVPKGSVPPQNRASQEVPWGSYRETPVPKEGSALRRAGKAKDAPSPFGRRPDGGGSTGGGRHSRGASLHVGVAPVPQRLVGFFDGLWGGPA